VYDNGITGILNFVHFLVFQKKVSGNRITGFLGFVVVIIIIIITGTTALCEPWPSSGLFAILPYCRSV
jgi:hypothetical protein